MTAMPSTKHPVLVSVDGTVSVEHNYMKKSEILLSSPKITVPLDKPGQLNDSNEPRSPDQINIFAGGWDDDEEDDYVDMAPLRVSGPGNRPVKDNEGPNSLQSESEKTTTTKYNDSGYYDEVSSESAHTRNDPHLSPRSILPSVVVLPASPHGSIPSQASNRSYKRTSMGSSSDSSSISSSSDSRSPEDSPFKIFSDRDNNSPEDNFESSNDPSTVTRESEIVNQESEGVGASSPLPTPPRVSVAGLAARKYLQMYKSSARSLSDSSKSSALQRSSSRVGTRGVQSRISKSRQQVTSPTRTRGSGDFEISSAQDERVRMEGGDKAVEDKKIKEDKKKSRTLDRDLRGTMLNSEMTYQHQSLEDLANGGDIELLGESKRRSKDGASVMRMIADRAKSQSLDGKYFEYLQGAAKHASAAPSKENSLIKSERKNSKSKNKKKKHKKKVEEEEEEEDEEEAYQKFAATMSSKTRSTGNICMMDVESVDSSLQGGRNGPPSASMSDIAVMRPKEKNRVDKLRKKKNSVSLAQRFSFRKSRTLGKLTSESKARGILMESGDANSELQPANGFQQIQEKENSPDSNDQPTTKPEKRKSWRGKRHGISVKQKSRDRMNSDPTDSGKQVSSQPSTPTKDPQRIFSDGDDTKQVDKKSFDTKPSIKQSLGFNSTNSPSLRPRKVSDDEEKTRTTSSERRTPVHSPKIMSPSGRRASTLGRGMSGMSNTSRIYRVDSTGHLGAHQPLKGVNSLNSENSGSNSDISLQYDEDMDDRRDRKAGTLTRLLGRKMRDKRYEYPDVEDESSGRLQDFFNTGSLGRRKKKGKSATLGSPAMALRMRHAHSREALLEVDGMSKIDMFFRKSEFVRGFRVVFDDYEDANVIDFETSPRVDPNRINKYATITGIRSPSHGNCDSSSRKTQDTAGPEEPELDGTPTPGRRNNSMSVVVESPIFRPRSIRIIKRPQGPSGHLAFNEVLTEDEVVGNSNDQLSSSPLLQRNRRRQAIEPLIEEPSAKILAAGKAIYRHLVATNLELLKTHFTADERDHYGAYAYGETIEEENKVTAYANSFYGQELVTWLIGQFKEATNGQDSSDVASKGTLTRENVIGMVQALLEEGAISHVRREHHFQDTLLLYQFHDSVTRNDDPCRPVSLESTVSSSTINSDVNSTTSMDTCDTEGQDAQVSDEITRTATVTKSSRVRDDQELKDILSFLQNVAPDAMFRMVLRKL